MLALTLSCARGACLQPGFGTQSAYDLRGISGVAGRNGEAAGPGEAVVMPGLAARFFRGGQCCNPPSVSRSRPGCRCAAQPRRLHLRAVHHLGRWARSWSKWDSRARSTSSLALWPGFCVGTSVAQFSTRAQGPSTAAVIPWFDCASALAFGYRGCTEWTNIVVGVHPVPGPEIQAERERELWKRVLSWMMRSRATAKPDREPELDQIERGQAFSPQLSCSSGFRPWYSPEKPGGERRFGTGIGNPWRIC